MATVNRDHRDKRQRSSTELSTGVSPPHTRLRTDSPAEDLVRQLTAALGDPQVIETLQTLLVKPLLDRLDEKDRVIDSLTKRVTVLEAAVDELEQYGRRNAVRIWSKSMPETPGERTDELVKAYAQKAGVDLPPNCIGRSHRVGRPTPGKVRPIIVKFTGYNFRKMIYDARKSVPDYFVSEDLTQTRSRILFKARQERQAGRFKHCWTTDGRINIRLNDDSKHVITSQAELDQLIDDNPLPNVA